MESIWNTDALPHFPRLNGDKKTDVLIIGGGITGILTAYFLRQYGIPYILVEKDRICGANTSFTTAKITAQHGLIYHRLAVDGIEKARAYLRANLAALKQYAVMCKDIPCDFRIRDSFVYSEDRQKLEKELDALDRTGYPAELCDTIPLPVKAAGTVRFPRQAQFDPMKFLTQIAAGLNIYEGTPVREMIGKVAVTPYGKITADTVICATHFHFINKHGFYFIKMYQYRSYVIALKNAPDVGGMYIGDTDDDFSFRNHGDTLLLGGGGGRTGRDHENWEKLRAFAREHYPDAVETRAFAAQDCMTLDGLPYIGQYSKKTPGFYVATGFNKWGMTGAMAAAMLLCDRIRGKRNEFYALFDPFRSILKPQLAVNAFESVKGWLTPSKRVCPHLGCALKWNAAEHSWDCPCHGSRFAEDGAVLNEPANGDLR